MFNRHARAYFAESAKGNGDGDIKGVTRCSVGFDGGGVVGGAAFFCAAVRFDKLGSLRLRWYRGWFVLRVDVVG